MPLDPEPRSSRRTSFATALKGVLGRAALFCYRNGVATLAIAALAACVAAIGAGRLKLDPDISELLPPSHASVKNLEELRRHVGGVGNVVVLVREGSPERRRAFADRIGKELEKLPTVRYVDVRRPSEFFEKHGLYFLDKADLETMAERLDARRRYEISRAQLDLDDEPAPPVELGDIRQKYRKRLEGSVGSDGGGSAYYEDARELAVFVHPTELASNLDFSRRVVADVERTLERVRSESVAAGLEVELGGRYKKRVDLASVLGRDLGFTGVLALVLVIGYVAFHFRRPSAVVLVMAPLLLGLELVYGVAGFGFGTLNILTAFVGAILLGIGIDNGIHMLGRYEESRAGGCSAEDAVVVAWSDAGRVSVAAALTTASAFGCLAFSEFRAFREFGLLAAAGMALVLLSYVTVLPAALGVFERYLPGLSKPRKRPGLPFVRGMMAGAPWVAAGLTFVMLALSLRAPAVHFDADFAALDRANLPSFESDARINRLLGRSQTPLVVLAADDAEAGRAADAVRARMIELGARATIGSVLSIGDLVPADQLEKRPVIERIGELLSRVNPRELRAEDARDYERLLAMSRAAPFTKSELPASVLKPFEPREGDGTAHFALLFPKVSMSDAVAVRELARQVSSVEAGQGRLLSAAGEPMIMADILAVVERDGPRILLLTLVLVLVALRLTGGSFTIALLSLLPAVLTMTVSAGVLALLGVDLNYLNMVMLPILLGVGVDDGMHVVTRAFEGEPLDTVWRHTGWDIFGAILTDIFGFGVLALAAHPGLASLGTVALVGLGVNLVASVVLLPALLATARRFSPGTRPAESG